MDLYQLREKFSEEGILMCFNGPFSHTLIEEIGIAIRNYLAAEQISHGAVQDVFAVYIEMTQNARNYLTARNMNQLDSGSATIVIARQSDRYHIKSGNVIRNSDIEALRNKLEKINGATAEELKKMIRQQLRAETVPGALGAGIGLMEMAKRGGGGIKFSFVPIDDSTSFFTLAVEFRGE